MNLNRLLVIRTHLPSLTQVSTITYFPPPPNYDNVEFPEKPKLRFMEKVPQYPPGMRAPKMQKKLRLMRGKEEVHNFLMHKQYGIMATGGGRLKYGHLEMIRLTLGRKLDMGRMFAVWRIDSPWQPVTKRGQGQRLGGGKGAIDHYVTPIKQGRIIVEVGGKCEYEEVKGVLEDLAKKMPFKAMAVSQKMLEEMKQKEEWVKKNNLNPYSMKYMIQNNIGGCWRWISPYDLKWLGEAH